MEIAKVCAIQNYLGKYEGKNLFSWNQITVPKCKEEYIERMNGKIEEIFKLTGIERMQAIDVFIMMEHNNGINQHFSFLIDYASKEVQEFIRQANSDTESIQKVK